MLNSNAIKKFLLNRKNSLTENILLCAAVTVTSAFLWYDNYYFYMDFLRVVVSVMIAAAWLWCGFLSGKDKKWGFLVFAGLFWLIPYLYVLFFKARDNANDPNAFLSLIYNFAFMLYDKPLKVIADFTNCEVYIWILSLAILTGTTYFVGVNVAEIYRDKEKSEQAENFDEDESDEFDENDESDYDDEDYDDGEYE